MRLDYQDYTKLVIAAYNKKRANNELPLLLAQPTPANIRQECVNVYRERYEKRDDMALRGFFGTVEHGRKFLDHIQKFEADKFRPLDTFLKDPSKNLTGKYLELLAWLIDFPHRPHEFGKNFILNGDELSLLDKSTKNAEEKQPEPEPVESDSTEAVKVSKQPVEEPEISLRNEPRKELVGKNSEHQIPAQAVLLNTAQKDRSKKAVIIILILVIFIGGLYVIWQEMHSKQTAYGTLNTGCMYWAVDHYEKVPCNEEQKDRLLLPLNEEKIKGFRRIMQEDTITEKSIGKVHYIKRNKTIEYYTTGGNHPIEVTRSLRPLSAYMFDKYLRKQEVANKGLGEGQKFINNR